MNKIDIDRLTSLLGDEFEIGSTYDDQRITIRKKVDPPNPLLNCDFYKTQVDNTIYKMTSKVKNSIAYGVELWILPASEEQYVEQLRATAFHLYGGISESDTFENPEGGKSSFYSGDTFKYLKEQDQLMLGQILLYDKGKWAKRFERDIWEGVEFVECTTDQALYFKRGKVYRLVAGANLGRGDCIYTEDGGKGSCLGIGGTKKNFKPSTIDAYVEQLKAKAFELYGEIQDQDKFEEPSGNIDTYRSVDNARNLKWDYIKDSYQLFFYSILLYEKGQWAKKLPKRIEVLSATMLQSDPNKDLWVMGFEINPEVKLSCNHHLFLAKELEKYLNGEIK